MTDKHNIPKGKMHSKCNIQRANPYRLMEVQLEHVFKEKDLGIIIDADLTVNVQVSKKIKKANNMLGLIRRSFSFLNADILLPLYNAFIRHLVEYGVPIWSGLLKRSQIRVIKKIQLWVTEMIKGMSYIEYDERLKLLRLPTLSYRGAGGNMIGVWKHYHVIPRLSHQPFSEQGLGGKCIRSSASVLGMVSGGTNRAPSTI